MTLPLLILAVVQSWSIAGEETVRGELGAFDFEAKTITLVAEDGTQRVVATEALSLQDRFQVLMSPVFVAGYPDGEWTPQQTRFVLLLAGMPAGYSFFAFWLAAALLLGRANPLRAALGFLGAWLIGLLLIGTYVVLATRLGHSVVGVGLFGALVSSFFVAMYVSVIYRTKTWNGFMVFFCHLFLAMILMALSAITVSKTIDAEKLDTILTRVVFEPVGLVAEASSSEP